jgi:ubiquinone/menaquinone biosynthesis C-methylase UbiE
MIGAVDMRTDITGPRSKDPPTFSASSEIRPEEYANWRKSPLMMITERIEQEAAFDLAGDLRGKRVLDLGCGDGSYSIHAARNEAHVVGVDISAAMFEAAQRRANDCGVSVRWCRASAESLPFGSGSFDVILAVTLLCFAKEPRLAAREASRVLRSGGSLVIRCAGLGCEDTARNRQCLKQLYRKSRVRRFVRVPMS